MSTDKLPGNLELKGRYNVSCCKCDHEFSFAPSMAMRTGFNTGHGSCSECKTFLRLTIDTINNTGTCKIWEPAQIELESTESEQYQKGNNTAYINIAKGNESKFVQ